jgi:mevalonate kinase
VSESLFVPGRLCLFGEHSDWAGAHRATHPEIAPGRCLVAGTDQGLRAEVALSDGVELESVLPDGGRRGPERIAATVPALDAVAHGRGFFSYAAGVAAEATGRFAVGGMRVTVVENDLPLAKGLSSSAAICVLVARAYNRLYGLGLDVRGEMALAHAGERRAGSQCGLMDQVCAYGRTTTLLTFDGLAWDVAPVAAGGVVHLLVVDLGHEKDTRRILADLNACFPDTPGRVAARVREALGDRNVALVGRACEHLGAGDAVGLGRLMVEAQALFDEHVAPACSALAAPRLHEVLAHRAVRELSWGGKGVGSQGDGSAQLVARGDHERRELAAWLARDLGVRSVPLTLGVAR